MSYRRYRGLSEYVAADVQGRLLAPRSDQVPTDVDPMQTAAEQLRAKAADVGEFFRTYAGRSLARPNGGVRREEYQPFFAPGNLAMPAADGLDYTVQTFVVPSGWDGVINRIAHIYTGPGQILGTGYLTWRIMRNGQPFKSFEAIQAPFGSVNAGGSMTPMELGQDGLLVYSEEIITYVVSHAAGSSLPTANNYILSFLGGRLWPRTQ